MKSWQRLAGLFLFAVSLVVIQQSVYVLRLFDGSQPGSGFMPFGLGVVLAILSVLLILTNLGPDLAPRRFLVPGVWHRPLVALVVMAGFGAAFNALGAVLDVVALVTVWLLILERKSVLVAVFTGVATGVVVYVVFELGLQAPFPRGVLFGG